MSRPRPKLFEVRYSKFTKNGCNWLITAYPEGKRVQVWFKTEKLAKQAANERNEEITSTGTQDTLPHAVRIAALIGTRQLETYGKTISDAVDFYRNHLERITSSITVAALCAKVQEEFDRRLNNKEVSHSHFYSMRDTLKKFKSQFENEKIKNLDGTTIKSWLSQKPLATTTKNKHFRYCRLLFGLAKEWKLVDTNPFDDVKIFNNPKKEIISILTPKEMQKFLSVLHKDFLPFYSISAFTGLRSQEVMRLDWNEVKLNRNLIDLPSTKSKNGRRKLITIPDNLKKILKPFEKIEGSIVPVNKIQKAKKNAVTSSGVIMPQNCIRHSFCSHSVSLNGSSWTAEQCDHSEKILKLHYREVVSKEDAISYFSIMI